MAASFDFPEHWWGPPPWWGQPDPLSIAALIQNGTLDARLAALCWLLVENRTPLFTAAGPQRAGKTALLTALMAFLPPGDAPVFPAGQRETFVFAGTADPAHTWIMVNELSDHLPVYLWGPPAARLFTLVEQGYAMGATLHADSPEEVIEYLSPPPVGLSAARLAATAPLLLFLRASMLDRQLQRRLSHIALLEPAERGAVAHTLAFWERAGDRFTINQEPAAWEALSQRTGLAGRRQTEEVEDRAGFLTGLVEQSVTGYDDVRAAILRWYGDG